MVSARVRALTRESAHQHCGQVPKSDRKAIELSASELYEEADALTLAAEDRRGTRGLIDEVVTDLLEAAESVRKAARKLDKTLA